MDIPMWKLLSGWCCAGQGQSWPRHYGHMVQRSDCPHPDASSAYAWIQVVLQLKKEWQEDTDRGSWVLLVWLVVQCSEIPFGPFPKV